MPIDVGNNQLNSVGANVLAFSNIVTDGLVLYFDGGIASSYPSTGTSWIDLSGYGNNGTLVNGPTYTTNSGGNIVFDGVDDYANFYAPNLGGTATVEMWANATSFGSNMFMGWLYYDLYAYAGGLGYNTGNSDVYGISAATVSSLGLSGNWKQYIFEMRSDVSYTNNKIYVNTVSQTLSQQLGSESPSTRNFNSGNGRIASWGGGGYNMAMNCAIFRVYNRSLTQSEIIQNFNANRRRFNI